MSKSILIADAGSTKTEWSLLRNGKVKSVETAGISPYFFRRSANCRITAQRTDTFLKKKRKLTRCFFMERDV